MEKHCGNALGQNLFSSKRKIVGYYLHSMMSVTLKQIFGQIIWAVGFMAMAFLLLDIPRVRTGIEKVPYWPVYGIKMLARVKSPR